MAASFWRSAAAQLPCRSAASSACCERGLASVSLTTRTVSPGSSLCTPAVTTTSPGAQAVADGHAVLAVGADRDRPQVDLARLRVDDPHRGLAVDLRRAR